MTEQEASERLKIFKECRCAEAIREVLDMSIKALEKQIPKKVVYKPEDAVYQIPYCPSCGEELYDANYTIGRCECGQNLFYGG